MEHDASVWVSNNVKVGWIGEALRLPLAEALVPIAKRAMEDGAAAERARVRRELKEAFDHCWCNERTFIAAKVIDALDRICPAQETALDSTTSSR